MAPLSHNLAAKSDQEELSNESTAKKKLSAKLLRKVDRAFMAEKLGVSESMISQWLSGSRPIPSERVFEIVKAGKFFCRDWRGLEDEIDLALLQMGE